MTVDQKKDLLLAILAMDSYNQGYKRGFEHEAKVIGSATVKQDPDKKVTDAWADVGFYAAAYDTGTGTVISYRGTNSYFGNGGDVLNGWIIATGQQTGQSALALEFYKSVTGKSVFEGNAGNVTVTGHSLGGGLAGLVSWLSGAEGLLFDHMPFGIAASIIAAQGEQPQSPPTGGGSQAPKRELHTEAAEGEYVKGEVLQAVRNGTLVGALATLPPPVLNALADWLGVPVDPDDPQLSVIEMALKIRAANSLVPKTEINPHAGFIVSPVNLHSMDYLVNLKFAGMAGHKDWQTVGKEFYEAYFNDDIGRTIGFQEANTGGTATPAGKMGRAIAYSTLGYDPKNPSADLIEGLVFGNVGAKAMFDDLNDLGRVYSVSKIDALLLGDINDGYIFDTSVKQALVDIAVQYAGALARHKVQVDLAIRKDSGRIEAGKGDDYVFVDKPAFIEAGSRVPSSAGGSGRGDTIASQDLMMKIFGGLGEDRLIVNGGERAELSGEEGRDLMFAAGTVKARLDGGIGNDAVVAGGGTGAVTIGGNGRDWIFNTSKGGVIYGDTIDGRSEDGTNLESRENSDNFWWWSNVTIMDAKPNDVLKFFDVLLTGGSQTIPVIEVNGGQLMP